MISLFDKSNKLLQSKQMQIDVKPGKYVVAVSGGVDSMVLLDLLRTLPGVELVVAHFEHGVREDSDEDRKLVEDVARRYGLVFVCEHGNLGPSVSEAAAREARYAFLNRAKEQNGAQAIITAHHEDDLLETAILNILRGTGRKGLSSLGSSDDLVRPLLHTSKQAIRDYAVTHEIAWHEDSTNDSDAYLRNYIRHEVVPKLGAEGRAALLGYIKKAQATNPDIDALLIKELKAHFADEGLQRYWFIMQPYDVSCEVVAAWLRRYAIRDFDRKTIERLVVAAKVAKPGKVIDVNAGYYLKIGKTHLQLSRFTS